MIVFAISLATILAFWILGAFISIDYYYAPPVISLLGLLYLISIRGFYRDRARSLVRGAKSMKSVCVLEPEEEKFFIASASFVLPRFYAGAQMPANGQSLLTLMNILFIPAALYFQHYIAAAASVAVLLVLLRKFGFFSRNEMFNMKQSCRFYLDADGLPCTDLNMQYSETLYITALKFASAQTGTNKSVMESSHDENPKMP